MKKVTIKEMIYWIAEEWHNVTEQMLQSLGNNYGRNFVIKSPDHVNDNHAVLHRLKDIPSCEETHEVTSQTSTAKI